MRKEKNSISVIFINKAVMFANKNRKLYWYISEIYRNFKLSLFQFMDSINATTFFALWNCIECSGEQKELFFIQIERKLNLEAGKEKCYFSCFYKP